MWEAFPGQPEADGTPQMPQRREIFPLFSLRQAVCNVGAPGEARPRPQRGEAVQMSPLRQGRSNVD